MDESRYAEIDACKTREERHALGCDGGEYIAYLRFQNRKKAEKIVVGNTGLTISKLIDEIVKLDKGGQYVLLGEMEENDRFTANVESW